MSHATIWTETEFEVLLQNPHLSDEELADRLPDRTSGAVGVVRSGICSFHKGGDISMLSQVMIRRLEGSRRDLECAVCGSPL